MSTETPALGRIRPAAPPPGPGPAASSAAAPGLAHHLLHRPATAEGLMLGTAAPVTQHFTLSARLPEHHPLFNDGPGNFHDLHYPVEAMRQSVLFVAHQYFRVPVQRSVVLASTELGISDLEAWRRMGRAANIAVDMALHPMDVVNGVPRGLNCESELSINGVRAGSAKARTVFLMPNVYHNHRARGRAASRGADIGGYVDALVDSRPGPEAVGRSDPRNVVITSPLPASDEQLRVLVAAQTAHPVFTANTTDHVPAVVLLEASRQAAFLAAGELHGFSAAHCALTRWNARFKGFAEVDLPLYCTVHAEDLGRDADGRRTFPVTLAFTQGTREITTVAVEVTQDY
ncbi:MAG TPA: AfsA-related hotdog domain-containing protein [Actinocrinis sp.]|nr:AfsA-related hotdog domain-containing protein [Actinocrinis sp.]